MNIGNAIKMCRTARQLSQSELAERAQLSVSYLSLLERGKRDPVLSTVVAIAKALDVPLSILVFLAASDGELESIGKELAEKFADVALRLMREATE